MRLRPCLHKYVFEIFSDNLATVYEHFKCLHVDANSVLQTFTRNRMLAYAFMVTQIIGCVYRRVSGVSSDSARVLKRA